MYAFIDESGDHNLDIAKSDGIYNVFVLALVLIDKKDYPKIDADFKQIKKDIFGDEDFIVHTAELTRSTGRRYDKRNLILKDPEKRREFYTRVNQFIKNSPMRFCLTVIKKSEFNEKYNRPIDPYELGFENALNRTLFYSNSEDIEMYLECRNNILDKVIRGEFAKYLVKGTRFHLPEEIRERIKKFSILKKEDNSTGMQIADLIATPVGRRFIGKKPKAIGNEVSYITVHEKLAGNSALSLSIMPRSTNLFSTM